MTPRIQKITDEINKTRGKIAKLQEELPILLRKRAELENAEIIRLVRSSDVAPEELAGVIASISKQSLTFETHDAGIIPADETEKTEKDGDATADKK